MTAAPSQTPEAAGLEYYGYRVFNAGIGVCHLVASPGLNDTNPEPLVTAASAQAAIDAEKARADRLAQVVVDLKKAFGDPMTRRALGGHNETQQAAILAATEALQQETQPYAR